MYHEFDLRISQIGCFLTDVFEIFSLCNEMLSSSFFNSFFFKKNIFAFLLSYNIPFPEGQSIVVDIGHDTTKAGFSGDDLPSVWIPSVSLFPLFLSDFTLLFFLQTVIYKSFSYYSHFTLSIRKQF